MAIHRDRDKRRNWFRVIESFNKHKYSNSKSHGWGFGISKFNQQFPKSQQQTELFDHQLRSTFPVHGNVSRTWDDESNSNSKGHGNHKRDRYNLSVYGLILCLVSALPARAETVGGVSATASPIANSTGSVTNQAIQVLQGPYITNTYGDGISCQGPTLNFTPYVTQSKSYQWPYEPTYNDPVYDMSDLDEDGILDNPGGILYEVPTRTGQKDNHNRSIGFSATLSFPLDGKAQELCKKAAATHNAYRAQLLANKRLDFELARLKNCGEMKKQGIYFHPKSPYYAVCADVMVNNPPGHAHPHTHSIPSPSASAGRASVSAAALVAALGIRSSASAQ